MKRGEGIGEGARVEVVVTIKIFSLPNIFHLHFIQIFHFITSFLCVCVYFFFYFFCLFLCAN